MVRFDKGVFLMATFGFIGTGNMGGAVAKAVAKAVGGESVFLSNRTAQKAEMVAKVTGGTVCDNETAARQDYIFLGVKPQMMAGMLEGIRPVLQERAAKGETFTLVTMAASLTIEKIREMAGVNAPIVRIMPNLPVSIGEGVILYTSDGAEATLPALLEALTPAGMLVPTEERLIDAGSAVAGCGPAFACLFAEALADGGVECGLPRAQAMKLALQMLAGTAQLLLQENEHPAVLKDAVCSPGGTTIAGVHALEKGGFRAAAIDAVKAAYDKTIALK